MESSKRCTVGVLIGYHIYEGSHPNPFTSPLIHGMQAAARDKDVNFMVACGVARGIGPSRHRPAWPELCAETDFVPIGPWNTDGLIFLGSLRSETRIQYVHHLRDGGFPVLFLGTDAGYPAIIVDNEGGIRQTMEHLIRHRHHEIAFIAGDEQDLGDSIARVNAYRQGVKEFGLVNDPRLVEYGQHWDVGGYNAMRRLLQSGVKFTAVMCSNDESALGVVKALREAGLRIPWDVAVTGFDDILEGLALVPPLTSIHYPLFETGYRTLLLLLKRIEQGPTALPELTRVSTSLALRQSCGCLPDVVTQSAIGTGSSVPSADKTPQQVKEELTQTILSALSAETPQARDSELLPYCDRMVDGFVKSLEGGDLSDFQTALMELLQHVETMSEDNAHVWQSAVTVLRQWAHSLLKDDRVLSRSEHVENLLHLARTMLSESAERRYSRLQMHQAHFDENMGLLTTRLISSSDEDEVYSALREDLPKVGVRNCQVVFFEPQREDPVAMSLLHPLEKSAPTLRFETRRFPPPGLYPDKEPFSLALLPLFFQKEKLGYVAFDGSSLDPLASLVRQLSSSIKNAQLYAKVLELSLTDGLTEVYNRRYFEILLQKETERSHRYNRDLTVIMIDIDHFKRYNDAFGHPAGDEALREVARSITRGVRRGLDVVTRYGGEEFAIILPETDADGARIVAENVRKEVETNRKFLQTITVSLGIASMHGKKLRSQLLVDQADRGLYQAKSQGRNRTVFFEDWMLEPAHSGGKVSKSINDHVPKVRRPK